MVKNTFLMMQIEWRIMNYNLEAFSKICLTTKGTKKAPSSQRRGRLYRFAPFVRTLRFNNCIIEMASNDLQTF